jgi:hypothetical protein
MRTMKERIERLEKAWQRTGRAFDKAVAEKRDEETVARLGRRLIRRNMKLKEYRKELEQGQAKAA